MGRGDGEEQQIEMLRGGRQCQGVLCSAADDPYYLQANEIECERCLAERYGLQPFTHGYTELVEEEEGFRALRASVEHGLVKANDGQRLCQGEACKHNIDGANILSPQQAILCDVCLAAKFGLDTAPLADDYEGRGQYYFEWDKLQQALQLSGSLSIANGGGSYVDVDRKDNFVDHRGGVHRSSYAAATAKGWVRVTSDLADAVITAASLNEGQSVYYDGQWRTLQHRSKDQLQFTDHSCWMITPKQKVLVRDSALHQAARSQTPDRG